MAERVFPTTVVGSYPQPDWLVNRETLRKALVPRIKMNKPAVSELVAYLKSRMEPGLPAAPR